MVFITIHAILPSINQNIQLFMFSKTKTLKEKVKRHLLSYPNKSSKSFTLVELLIVISILAVLSSAVVVVINPIEMLRQGRDITRMREVSSINRTLSMFQKDRPTVSMGLANRIHVSIPDTSTTCANLGLPTLPLGWEYRCVPIADLRRIDGNGWIPINFTTMFQGSPLASLPIDPTNTTASSNFYVYVTDGRTWVLASLLESERHAPFASRDGGTDPARFEAGTNLALWTTASGLVGYWSFDGTGSIANNQEAGLRDMSGRDNHGTASNANATGMAFVPGRVGTAISFDGVDDRVALGRRPILHISRAVTQEAWVRPASFVEIGIIIRNGLGLDLQYSMLVGTNRSLVFHWFDGLFRNVGTLPNLIPLNEWTHIVAVREANNNIILYINGVAKANQMGTQETGGGGDINIGSTQPGGAGQDFHGLIDEVRIHNRALTEAEIRTHFNATR